MKRKLSEFIETNEQLYTFVKKIYNYHYAINSKELRYLFMVSLISSDNLIDVESCKANIADMSFIKDNIDLITTDDEIKKETLKYINDGLKIAKRDLKCFEKSKNSK